MQLLFARRNLLSPEIRGKSTRKKTTTSRMGRKKSGAKSGRGQDLTGRFDENSQFFSADQMIPTAAKEITSSQISRQTDMIPFTEDDRKQVQTRMEQLVRNCLHFLDFHKFVERILPEEELTVDSEWKAMHFGTMTSNFYLDVEDAIIYRDDLEYAEALVENSEITVTELTWLYLLVKAKSFVKLVPRREDLGILIPYIENHADNLIEEEIWDPGNPHFESFAQAVKHAWILEEWIGEYPEKEIVEHFNIGQGDLHRVVETAQWLIRALCQVSAIFEHKRFDQPLYDISQRIQYGIKAELLPLIELRGIGRVRARKLYHEGFKTLIDIQKATIEQLSAVPLLGPELAKKIQAQANIILNGEESDENVSGKLAPP